MFYGILLFLKGLVIGFQLLKVYVALLNVLRLNEISLMLSFELDLGAVFLMQGSCPLNMAQTVRLGCWFTVSLGVVIMN